MELYCIKCSEEKENKKFTLFKRNPSLKNRKGHVTICKDCVTSFVSDRNNTKQALREVCQLIDVPYVESFADSALKQFKKREKASKDGKLSESKDQANIFGCYARYLNIINPNYLNYGYSDGVRDGNIEGKINKLEQLKQDLVPTEVVEREENIKKNMRYITNLFGADVVADAEKLSKVMKIKLDEFSTIGNSTARNRKFQLKQHMKYLVDENVFEKENFLYLYDDVKERDNSDNEDYDINALTDKWGFGYSTQELIAFEKKYQALKNNYPERTALHIEALQTYCRYRVKEEVATAKGNVKEAKDWGDLANKQAQSAKININQLSKSDLTMGLSTFGELVRMVETSVDIIPILPQFKEKPQDKVDFTLWCYINYIRDLKGLPPADYNDIYKFYEERKKEQEDRLEFLNDSEKDGDTDGRSEV